MHKWVTATHTQNNTQAPDWYHSKTNTTKMTLFVFGFSQVGRIGREANEAMSGWWIGGRIASRKSMWRDFMWR